jgi:DNA polymerase III epsilon subunit-like protein
VDALSLSERKLSDLSFVAFDTEATGYSNVSDRLIEIAGIRVRWRETAWVTEGVFEELIDPGRPIPPDTAAFLGLDDAVVAGAARPVEVLDRFFAFARDALLVVHYAPADTGMMAFAYAREGLPAPDAHVLDTWALARGLVPDLKSYALETLAARLGLPAPSHRAMPDARATRALFEHCVAQLGPAASVTVGALVEHGGPLITLEEFSGLPLSLPESLAPIERGIAEGRDLTIEYRGGSKGREPRRVTPSYLFARQGHEYLEGYCHLDRAMKSFRLDRIERATLIEKAESG